MDRTHPVESRAPAAEDQVAEALSLNAQHLRTLHDNAEALFDPLGVLAPLTHAHMLWLLHPQELAERCARFSTEFFTLQMHTLARLAGRGGADFVRPQADDSRFSERVWTDELQWDLLKQWCLFYTRQIEDALFETPGLSPKERRRGAF